MKIFVRLLAILTLIIITVVFFISLHFKKSLPKINGKLSIKALRNPVKIVRDKYGVPHIYGENEEDIFFALGFVHAQERLWQLDLLRRMAEGRLAELFGNIKIQNDPEIGDTLVHSDKFKRVLGFYHISKKIKENIPNWKIKSIMQAYTDGVNEYINSNKNNLPPEFVILGYKPEEWEVEDTIAIGKFISWNLSGNFEEEILRYLIAEKAGIDKAMELFPKRHDIGHYIINEKLAGVEEQKSKKAKKSKEAEKNEKVVDRGRMGELLTTNSFCFVKKRTNHKAKSKKQRIKKSYRITNQKSRQEFTIMKNPTPQFTNLKSHSTNYRNHISAILNIFQTPASNNWVVSGKMTKSGKPILANDPHLLHTLPSLFFAVHLKSKSFDVIGVTFAGIPFILIGHNKHIAWGATTTCADVTDLFVEKIHPQNPNLYLFGGNWVPFEKRIETILIKSPEKEKKFKKIEIEVVSSVHGPVVNQLFSSLSKSPPISVRWAGYDAVRDGESYYYLMFAKNIEDFKKAITYNESPIQNWVFADIEGNIGYFPNGLVPKRKNGDGLFPVEGWTGKYEWSRYLFPSEIPQIYNPAEQFIITANNKVIDEEKYKYTFSYDYAPHYRSERIRRLLAKRKNLTIDDMKKIQADNYSLKGKRLATYFIKAYTSLRNTRSRSKSETLKIYDEAIDKLKTWDFYTNKNALGASLFFKSYSIAIQKTLEDELGSIFNYYLKSKNFETAFDRIIEEGKSPLFDNKTTPEVENRDKILYDSFISAVDFLRMKLGKNQKNWKWGKINTITFSHPFSAKKPLNWFFSFGPFPAEGERNTINLAHSSFIDETFKVTSGPVLRFVIDMADVDNAEFILDTGQSGHFKSKHFSDMIKPFLENKTVKLLFNDKDIIENAQGTLLLIGGKNNRGL